MSKKAGQLQFLAVQRWTSGEHHRLATTGAAYQQWWFDYEPSLVEWNVLVEFDTEWQTTVVPLSEH